jgi:hypothetical protein
MGRLAMLALLCAAVFAQEDGGPDHFAVKGVAQNDTLTLRAEPDAASEALAHIPYNATCLRNLGCRGGLTFQEFSTLSEADKKKRLAANPRWCKVEYQGKTGWVAGRYVAEGACTTPAKDRN